MITLTRPQRDALVYMAAHTSITVRKGVSIATLRVLAGHGLVTITHDGKRWVGHITAQGRNWLQKRAADAATRDRDDMAADRRTQYRDRAATYVRDALPVLEKLDGATYNTRWAVAELRNVPHPGRTPARLEKIGWWLHDNNYSGDVYEIAMALIEISEACAYRAYPVEQFMLDRLTCHEETLSEIRTRLGMT